ncbi:UPF0311 protein [Microbacterium aerolatum]|uniref:UPF0311 protein MAE01_15870 n=2 Tax=Microbacterium aerolatum TaxID=153731 RepID=A0A511AI62_9MICO|nr:DUF3237 domain-containing protein [Microbacterium aerolatum]GEK86411.1 UPF0311 protein [Microbacterium aerolatum]GGB22656.1 UPF0311 protein [Microbacterium aerolatum]
MSEVSSLAADMPSPTLDHVLTITLQFDNRFKTPMMLGGAQHGWISVTGGSFEGPLLRGKVLPGGGDPSLTRPDGLVVVGARYILQEDDGTMISLYNPGIRDGSPQVKAGVDPALVIDTEAFDLRTSPVFDTPAGKHDWLTRSTFVGVGRKLPDGNGNRIHYFKVNA